ncbi:MAG: uracil-DNA glycosylase [Rhodothalassiaceae bacterium]
MTTSSERAEPDRHCALCPRLVTFRAANQATYPDYFNGAVPSFGASNARLAVIGLAPGLHGANKTGRPFTGDYAGEILYPGLMHADLAHGRFDRRPDDGLKLVDTLITNAVRCVPPDNKPTGAEITTCRRFLIARLQALPQLKVILALGRIAHDSCLKALGQKLSAYRFAHGAVHRLGAVTLVDSYHCSRYNVNTGRLTEAMFRDVLQTVKAHLHQASTAAP